MHPQDWNVVSNERDAPAYHDVELKTKSSFAEIAKGFGQNLVADGYKVAVFPATPNIATYIMAVVAGPYGFFEHQYDPKTPTIP